MTFIGHSSPDGVREPQTLREHLTNVSQRAESFFEQPFMREAARQEGLYHDAGKYQALVQQRLRGTNREKTDHATLGGQLLAMRSHKVLRFLAAAPILGHHGGMPDCMGKPEKGRSIEVRLANDIDREAVAAFDREMGDLARALPDPRGMPIRSAKTMKIEAFLLTRMIHSAVTDADALDTEHYYKPEHSTERGQAPSLAELKCRYDRYMAGFTVRNPIDTVRADIRNQCLRAAEGEQGFYTLAVPTGGGKTLSSLGFALYHAMRWPNLKRVIYAIPFTSIVEQNAAVFRDALGDDAVLEHHSAVRPPEEGTQTDLATENWDMPLIVTTNVQLFESLFSNLPSRSRKVHNLQDSVLILDEAQALPDATLKPCLNMLDALVKDYRVTVVLCSATQPTYDMLWDEPPKMREIIRQPDELAERLRRTRCVDLSVLDDAALLERLQAQEQVLCIVNNRKHAQELHSQLGGEANGAYHLSTLMCPEHRMQTLCWIRTLLKRGHRCRLISTSLIEAGVDVDFPVVYRARAGLDSIVQAAGRCNRNALQESLAPVYIFEPSEEKAPPETKRLASMTFSQIATNYPDLLSSEAMRAYFRLRFGSGAVLDQKRVIARIREYEPFEYPYATIAQDFRMIQSVGEPVYVPYNEEAREWIARLAEEGASSRLLRRLQRYGVTLYPQQVAALKEKGFLRVADGVHWVDVSDAQWQETYSPEYGLQTVSELTAMIL